MRSKTSCFNRTLFFKNITRFWPVWAAYLAVWVLLVPLVLLSARDSYVQNPMDVQPLLLNMGAFGGAIMSAIFSILMAMCVWSFLYNSRSANGTACLPVRREGQFLSAMLGGFVPLLASNVLVAVLTLLAELSIGCLHLPSLLQSFALSVLPLFFFYGFATLCAQLTGNIVVLPLVYAVLNFVVYAVTELLRVIGNLFLYGMSRDALNYGLATYFSPLMGMLTKVEVTTDYVTNAATGARELAGCHFEGWGLMGIYAVAGLVLCAGALLLLRRRRMESAGDVVAVRVLKPVFRWCMALGSALCFACLMYAIFGVTAYDITQCGLFAAAVICLLLGGFIGWFAAEMLIRKTFRVFRSNWAGFGLCCLVIVAGMLCMEFDIFGYERRVPAADKVESVILQAEGQGACLTDPADIAAATELHRDIISHKSLQDQSGSGPYFSGYRISGRITYVLKNGSRLTRMYYLPGDLSNAADSDALAMQTLLNCPAAVQARKQTAFPYTAENISYGSISATLTAPECAAAAGYDSAEDYVLQELIGLSREAAAAMSEAERTEQIRSAVEKYAANGMKYSDAYYEDVEYYGFGMDPSDPDDQARIRQAQAEMAALPTTVEAPRITGDIDLDEVLFRYEWTFTPAELYALYHDCIVPDIEDNTLGRVWILSGTPDYVQTVCDAEIHIEARQTVDDPEGGAPIVRYDNFYTTPTVDAARTNAWLAEHGVVMHTQQELTGLRAFG